MTAVPGPQEAAEVGRVDRSVSVTRGRGDVPICGVRCYGGGSSGTRKHANVDLPVMFQCNRRVRVEGQRCYQHGATS